VDTPTPYFDFAHADYTAINRCLAGYNWDEIFSNSITVEELA